MRKIVWLIFGGIFLAVSVQAADKKPSRKVQKIETMYAATQNPASLRGNKAFMKTLIQVIARADEDAVGVIDCYATFIYTSGLKADVEKVLDKMSKDLKQSEVGQRVLDRYFRVRELNVGSRVPDFTLKTPDGKSVNFYTFLKGKKCVVLDFWASWCGWCRKESPFVQKVYDQYRGEDFDVISVSFDTQQEDWVKAIEDDHTAWTQVSDLKGTKSGLYKWYDLNGIPAIFLIDGNGRILCKGMRGAVIEKEVKAVLGK